jgi:hypothetical protein
MRGFHIRSQSLLRLSIAGIALLFPWDTTIAQTASVPPAKVTGTAQIQSMSASCKVPKNGGTCSFSFPAYQAPITGTTVAVNAPVSLSGLKATFSCDFSKGVTTVNPDGTTSITGVVCTMAVPK